MFLPQPPNDGEKYLYVHQGKVFLYSFGIVSTSLLLLGGILFSVNNSEFAWYLPIVFLLGFYLAISYLIGLVSKPFKFKAHVRKINKHRDFKPTVDVFLPCASEPLEVLYNTYKYVAELKWPNLNVYVLDDSGRVEVKEAAEWYKFNYISRPNKGHLKKSGNLRYAFPLTSGEFFLILDADFCPRPDFLAETIPYFLDPQLAVAQTPQFFVVQQNMPWIQRGAGSIQELFYRMIQVNRNHFGASICVGTCAVYRRSALEPFGGTYPIEHSEDVHTGFNLLKHGWKIQYIPINLSAGACPDHISSFFMQQLRWCTGSTSLFLNKELFWKTKLTVMQRLCFLSGMLYYQATALSIFANPIPGLLILWFHPDKLYWHNLIFTFPSFLFGIVHMKLWNRLPYGLFAVRARQVSYYAHLFAIWDKLRGKTKPWIPSGDNKLTKASWTFIKFRRFFIVWNSLVTLGTVGGIYVNGSGIMYYDLLPYVIINTFYMTLNFSCLLGQGVKDGKTAMSVPGLFHRLRSFCRKSRKDH